MHKQAFYDEIESIVINWFYDQGFVEEEVGGINIEGSFNETNFETNAKFDNQENAISDRECQSSWAKLLLRVARCELQN